MVRHMGVLAESVKWIYNGSGVKTPSDYLPAIIYADPYQMLSEILQDISRQRRKLRGHEIKA
jgi:hypothetical protein